MKSLKTGFCALYCLALLNATSLFAGYSPVTSVSSDDPRPDLGYDCSKWSYYHHLDNCEEYKLADPTYALEDDTGWPGQKEEFSDVLDPVIW